MNKLTQKEKARRYDFVMEELQDLVQRIERVAKEINEIEDQPKMIDLKENDQYYIHTLAGMLLAQGYNLELQLITAKSTLKMYSNEA